MPSIEKISVTLPAEVAAEVHDAVASGEYPSPDEVVREAVEDWNSRRHPHQPTAGNLRALWQQARATEAPGLPPGELLDRLERKYQALTDEAGPSH